MSSVQSRLDGLTDAMDSIQSVSEWIVFFRNFDEVARVWQANVMWLDKTRMDRILTLFYLANDVLQRAARGCNAESARFIPAFAAVLPDAVRHVAIVAPADSRVFAGVARILGIWKVRGIFPSEDSVASLCGILGVDYARLTDAKVPPPLVPPMCSTDAIAQALASLTAAPADVPAAPADEDVPPALEPVDAAAADDRQRRVDAAVAAATALAAALAALADVDARAHELQERATSMAVEIRALTDSDGADSTAHRDKRARVA